MPDSKPEEVALAFVARINAHDVEAILSLMTPDHVFADALGQRIVGKEAIGTAWRTYLRLFPDYQIDIRQPVRRILAANRGLKDARC